MAKIKKKRVTVELTEKQARTVLVAVEEYFRLRMGQANACGLADDLAFAEHNRTKDADGRGFDLALQRRDHINHVLKAIFYMVWPIYGTPEKKTEPVLIAGDIWSQLRYELGPKDMFCSTPIQLGPEPLPQITVEVFEDGR